MYKMFNFEPNGDLVINYNNSSITMAADGDIYIKAGRHLRQDFELNFVGCDDDFVEETCQTLEQ